MKEAREIRTLMLAIDIMERNLCEIGARNALGGEGIVAVSFCNIIMRWRAEGIWINTPTGMSFLVSGSDREGHFLFCSDTRPNPYQYDSFIPVLDEADNLRPQFRELIHGF